jgi:hypothetical protein
MPALLVLRPRLRDRLRQRDRRARGLLADAGLGTLRETRMQIGRRRRAHTGFDMILARSRMEAEGAQLVARLLA